MLKSKRELDENVLAAWVLLEAMRRSRHIQVTETHRMQELLRAFAIEICKQQPYSDRIVAGGTTLIKFPTDGFHNKADYLTHHSHARTWGEDAVLFPVLEALGYQPVMHLHGTHVPPYAPFVQQVSDNPLRIDIVNYGAALGGTHWELKGTKNPDGGGNCMYYTIAQQIQKDITEMQAKVPEHQITEIQIALQVAGEHNPLAIPMRVPAEKIREDNVITRQIKQTQVVDNTDAQRRKEAATQLDKFSTRELVTLYKIAREIDGDYLNGRLKEIAKECGLNQEDPANFMRQAVEEAMIDPSFESIIREELVHALSVEAGRSEKSYYWLKGLNISKVANLEIPKKYADEVARHTGTHALHAQPGFKPPRLVK